VATHGGEKKLIKCGVKERRFTEMNQGRGITGGESARRVEGTGSKCQAGS